MVHNEQRGGGGGAISNRNIQSLSRNKGHNDKPGFWNELNKETGKQHMEAGYQSIYEADTEMH